jgi:hypothetical protein
MTGETLAAVDLAPRRPARYTVTREGADLPRPARDLAADMAAALAAVDEIRSGAAADLPDDALCTLLGAVRRASAALAATQDELILLARECDAEHAPITWRTLGEAMDGMHLTTVRERHGRLLEGRTHTWRPWLTSGTERADLYARPAPGRRGDVLPPGACQQCGSRNVGESLLGDGSVCQDCGTEQ